MEGKGVIAIAVMFMVMMIGMVAEQTYATSTNSIFDFPVCFAKCSWYCNIPFLNVPFCARECLARCLPSSISDVNHYCNFGCASSKCTNISTLFNHRAEAVGNCVKSCNGICAKHY
ncbi:hypothetical protein IFM89_035213 [Coptis chinensis]|uniref:Thionin-like protein n=1 Tax=Coptis chinensis TaxID=261450 RepID=A0A835IHR1_9MAGN|nr:hypothetical protein IFM89_035213 [Coptis chinensis]